MLGFSLLDREQPPRHVLAIGAHSDDIEIGCGGTMLALCEREGLAITWVVLGAEGQREEEARSSAHAFLGDGPDRAFACHGFRDGFFPYVGGEIKDVFESMKSLEPDLIFTHARDDLHQDHRLVNELTWNTWRDHLILEYEIPKYDGDLGVPNVFVRLSREHAERKAGLLVELFASQRDKHWFAEELFLGLMRLRGAESRAPSGFAEGFYARKLPLDLGGVL